MALIKCPECGKEISDKVKNCIQCGYPISHMESDGKAKKTRHILIIAVIVAFVVFLVLLSAVFIKSSKVTQDEVEPEQNNEQLSLIITEVYLDDIYDSFVSNQDAIANALMIYGEFETLDDIKNFERPWKLAIDAFDKDIEILIQNNPAEEYADVWNSFYTNLEELRNLCVPFTNLDPNGDGHYTSEEGDKIYNENVPKLKDTISAILEDCRQFLELKEVNAIVVPEASTAKVENNYAEYKAKCTECGKTASYSYKNPFSGKEEPYCYTHYNEIIDMMGSMENDVGSSKQSKHTCEECSKEGTHVYYSFTGQTEYYCTKHYEELKDLLKALGVE